VAEKGKTSADNGKENEATCIRQAARKQVNKTMAPQVRIKMVSSYGDPCNERVTG
jgi:hypothetical protein